MRQAYARELLASAHLAGDQLPHDHAVGVHIRRTRQPAVAQQLCACTGVALYNPLHHARACTLATRTHAREQQGLAALGRRWQGVGTGTWGHVSHGAVGLRADVRALVHVQHARQAKVRELRTPRQNRPSAPIAHHGPNDAPRTPSAHRAHDTCACSVRHSHDQWQLARRGVFQGLRGARTLQVKPRESVPVERSSTFAVFRSPWIRPEVCR